MKVCLDVDFHEGTRPGGIDGDPHLRLLYETIFFDPEVLDIRFGPAITSKRDLSWQ